MTLEENIKLNLKFVLALKFSSAQLRKRKTKLILDLYEVRWMSQWDVYS